MLKSFLRKMTSMLIILSLLMSSIAVTAVPVLADASETNGKCILPFGGRAAFRRPAELRHKRISGRKCGYNWVQKKLSFTQNIPKLRIRGLKVYFMVDFIFGMNYCKK